MMNLFTELELLRFDRIAFAHSLTAADYRYRLDNLGYGIYGEAPEKGGVLEIGFVEENPLILHTDAGDFEIGENCIFVIPPNCSFSVESRDPGIHRHTGVEFLISCNATKVPAFQQPEGQTLTLPLIIPPMPGSNEVFSLIRSVVCTWGAQPVRSYFEECAEFMLLLSKLSQLAWSAEDSDRVSPGNRRYCTRAKTYVSENIHRGLTVSEISEALSISKNYLTNIFKDTEGMPLKEYINRRKLGYMLELMRRYDYSLAQAAEYVGYNDPNYVSRLFKKYYGVTVSQYRNALDQKG